MNSSSLLPAKPARRSKRISPYRNPETVSRDSSNSEPIDYVSLAINYAEEAIDDTRRTWAGHWIRLAAKRFIEDLKRTQLKRPPFYFSARWANKVCHFIEQLPHVEGTWNPPNIVLQPAQIFFLVQLFGFRDHEGGRRFTEALYNTARKNAKTTIAATIALVVLALEREIGAELVSAARTGDQARKALKIAHDMAERSPGLLEEFDIEVFAKHLVNNETRGVFKAINSKASTQDGLNPNLVELDEVHAHKDHDLMNVLRSAAGGRKNPLWLYTTTEGYETPGPWPELRSFSRSILEGLFKADHFLACIWAMDDDDTDEDDFNEAKWIKANPLLEVNPLLLRELRKIAINARQMPGTHGEFRIKRLNRPASSAQAWISIPKFKRCSGPVDLEWLKDFPCVAALDLANTMDMNAWRLLWLIEDRFYTWGRYWVPEDAAAQRTVRRSVPYAAWIAAGFIRQTPGDVTDYNVIEADILEDFGRFNISAVAYDPWNATQLANNLIGQGMPLQQFIQGPRSYNPAMKAFEMAYTSGRLNHGGNPVLTWNASNIVARRDVNMNLAPDRKRSAEKIDGMTALLMAFGLLVSENPAGFDHMLKNIVSV